MKEDEITEGKPLHKVPHHVSAALTQPPVRKGLTDKNALGMPLSVDEQWDASLLEDSDLLEDMVRETVEEHEKGLTRRVKIATR